MADNQDKADEIRELGKTLDYEGAALEGLARSWEMDDKECQALALADAQVYATLHLADQVARVAVSLEVARV